MTPSELVAILDRHERILLGQRDGALANLSMQNLSGAYISSRPTTGRLEGAPCR